MSETTTSVPPSPGRAAAGSRTRWLATLGLLALAGSGALAVTPMVHAATAYTFDTGSGLAFTIDAGNGNLTSLRHNGVELSAGVAGQFESGWTKANVSRRTFDNGNSALVTAANPDIGVTQYYFARNGDNTIYMATRITAALDPGEARFISRVSSSLLPNSPVAARTAGNVGAVEGSDVFRFADGTTASKFYSSQRLIGQHPYGATGNGHGVFIIPGSQELSSGGPFFRDIEVNDTGSAVNLTRYLFSGHAQTEPMRMGLHGPYALAVTDGAQPAAADLGFLSAYIPGLPSAAQRGTVTGTAAGSWNGLTVTAALAGPNGQYWAPIQGGRFTIANVRPGAYQATLYAGELQVGAPVSVTVAAGSATVIGLSGDVPAPGRLFQLGVFDGTPGGFLNADKIATEHPSDVRMASWKAGTVNASGAASAFPMAIFQAVNSPTAVSFQLASVPATGARLRIGITVGYDGGRPAIAIGGYSSPTSDSPASVNLDSRSITRGTWRGVNQTYAFTIPASALRVGVNALSISAVGPAGLGGYLSASFAVDALALDPA